MRVSTDWRFWLLISISTSALVAVFFVSPIAQDPTYHQFADNRTLLGLANFFDVLSNLPFVLVGIFGLTQVAKLQSVDFRKAYLICCSAVIAVGFGSAYYHYAPTTSTLLWDRLPRTVAFMALFAMLIIARISVHMGQRLLWPLIALGILSVWYWYWTEQLGRGDLRAYGLVQFLPIVLIPIILLLYPGKNLKASWLGATLVSYALAKITEHFDQAIYHLLPISGHTLKHLLASVAVLWVIIAVSNTSKIKQP